MSILRNPHLLHRLWYYGLFSALMFGPVVILFFWSGSEEARLYTTIGWSVFVLLIALATRHHFERWNQAIKAEKADPSKSSSPV